MGFIKQTVYMASTLALTLALALSSIWQFEQLKEAVCQLIK